MSGDDRERAEALGRLVREMIARPEGPVALGIQAALERALAPRLTSHAERHARDVVKPALADRRRD